MSVGRRPRGEWCRGRRGRCRRDGRCRRRRASRRGCGRMRSVARSALGHQRPHRCRRCADARPGGALARLFGPPLLAVVLASSRHRRAAWPRSTRAPAAPGGGDRSHARRVPRPPTRRGVRCRGRRAARSVALLLRTPVAALLAAVAGFVVGLTRSRRRLEREVAARGDRIRLELYTVNHLLAMHVRTGRGSDAGGATPRRPRPRRGGRRAPRRAGVDTQRDGRSGRVPPRGRAHVPSRARRGRTNCWRPVWSVASIWRAACSR